MKHAEKYPIDKAIVVAVKSIARDFHVSQTQIWQTCFEMGCILHIEGALYQEPRNKKGGK